MYLWLLSIVSNEKTFFPFYCLKCKNFFSFLLSQMQKLFFLSIVSIAKTFFPFYCLKCKNFFSFLLSQMQILFFLSIVSNAKTFFPFYCVKFHLVSLKLVQLYHGMISQMSVLYVLKTLALRKILVYVGLL